MPVFHAGLAPTPLNQVDGFLYSLSFGTDYDGIQRPAALFVFLAHIQAMLVHNTAFAISKYFDPYFLLFGTVSWPAVTTLV